MQGNGPEVTVIGAAYIDMAIKCSRFPSTIQSVSGSALSYTPTGPGPNQSAQAALCGCSVHLICKTGGDPFGQMIRDSLGRLNINNDFVYTAEAKNTGVIVTLVNADGENACVQYAGANTALSEHDISAAEQVISESKVCLIHGELPSDAIVSAIRLAKVHGAKVILNPARPTSQLPQKHSGALPDEYFNADVLIPNLYEAADIVETSDAGVRTAKLIGSDIVARGAGAAVITMGKRGCMIVERSATEHVAAFEVELVDDAGRGDAFAGALAAYLAVENDLKSAVKFASAAGALACTKFGSFEAMSTKAEIIELLQKEARE